MVKTRFMMNYKKKLKINSRKFHHFVHIINDIINFIN